MSSRMPAATPRPRSWLPSMFCSPSIRVCAVQSNQSGRSKGAPKPFLEFGSSKQSVIVQADSATTACRGGWSYQCQRRQCSVTCTAWSSLVSFAACETELTVPLTNDADAIIAASAPSSSLTRCPNGPAGRGFNSIRYTQHKGSSEPSRPTPLGEEAIYLVT
eukprot:1178427-Prorocentrum_minimum.AAC.4